MVQWWKRSPPTNVDPGSILARVLLLSVLALRRVFFSEFSGFPPSSKTNISKFLSDQDRAPAWKPAKADVASSLNILI